MSPGVFLARSPRRMKKQSGSRPNLRYFAVFTKMIRKSNVTFAMILVGDSSCLSSA